MAVATGFDFPLNPPDGEGYGVPEAALDFLERTRCAMGTKTVFHPGQDFNELMGEDFGDPVHAIADGTIKFAGSGGITWGTIILLEHGGSFLLPEGGTVTNPDSQYAHLETIGVNPRTGEPWQPGDVVSANEELGTVGDADGRYRPHLHLEIRKADLPADAFPCGVEDVTQVAARYTHPTQFIELNRLGETCIVIRNFFPPPFYDNAQPLPVQYGQTFLATSDTVRGMRLGIDDPTRPDDFQVNELVGPAALVLYDISDLGAPLELRRQIVVQPGVEISGVHDFVFGEPVPVVPGEKYLLTIATSDNYGVALTGDESTYPDGEEAEIRDGVVILHASQRDYSFRLYGACEEQGHDGD